MRAALLLLLAALEAAGAGRCRDTGRRCLAPTPPLLRVLPPGNTVALAAGTLTGSRGETLTVTRGSTKTCTNASGVVVTLSSNQPCVETAGLSVEPAATNLILQSETLNTTWTKVASPGAAPSISVNTTDVADIYGTNLAEKIAYAATSGTNQYSVLSQAATITAGTYTCAFSLRAAAPLTTYLYQHDGATLKGTPTLCSVTTSWTRCTNTATYSGTTGVCNLGVNRNVSGGFSVAMADLPAQTLYAMAAQFERSSVATSYIATTTTATTRAADVVSAGSLVLGATPSLGVTAKLQALPANATLVQPYNSGDATLMQLVARSSDSKVSCGNGTDAAVSSGTITLGTAFRASCTYDGTNYRVCLNGTCGSAAGAAPGATTFTAQNFGNGLTGTSTNALGWLTALCVNNRAGTCL